MSKVKVTQRPSDLINIKDRIPNILERMDYATAENFTGEIVPGYGAPIAILQEEAVTALQKIQEELNQNGFGLVIYDAYRPNHSVEYFHQEWLNKPEVQQIKAKYYPTKSKNELFDEGFLAKNSSHSRASTVDLSMVRLDTQEELDMGTIFDFFDDKSFTDSQDINSSAIQNRKILNRFMNKHGFLNYPKEWWHFRYQNEKYKHFYFDFEIN